MTPAQLAEKNTESGHQKAVFAWAAMARYKGFEAANSETAYGPGGQNTVWKNPISDGTHVLQWLHAIPNGGNRDKTTAARMKAEGVRSGVADLFLPVARHGYHGLYIEMKKPGPGGRLSDEQCQFRDFVLEQGYYWTMCSHWEEAVKVLSNYLT